jgi:molecular chaperone DnaK
MAEQEPVIGIDLGTTNSVVAIVQGGHPHVIRNRTGQALTPGGGGDQRREAAGGAARQAPGHHQPREHGLRQQAAHRPEVQLDQIRRARESLPYRIVSGEHDDVRVQMGDKAVSLPEIPPRSCAS